jgi:tape measure domain-containing protein
VATGRSVGEVFLRTRADTSRLGGDLKTQGEKAARGAGTHAGTQFGESMTSTMRGFAGRVGGAVSLMTGAVAGVGLAGLVTFGLKTAASLQQAEIGFTTLIGSGRKAKTFLEGLKSFAAKTPFELPGLIESSRTLLGVGLDAKKVVPLLQAFGDTAGAVGVGQEAFQRIMLATSQAISAGKFGAGDLNQIMTNGIPIWSILSKAMGKTVPELRKMAEQGKLLSKDVLPLLQKQMGKDYGGAMAAQSKTLAGVWSTLKDTVAIGLADAIKPLVPLLSDLVPRAADLAQRGLKQFSLGVRALGAAFQGEGVTSDGFVGKMERIGVVARVVWTWIRDTAIPVIKDVGAKLLEVGRFALSVAAWFKEHQQAIVALAAAFVVLKVAVIAYNIQQAIMAAGGVLQWIGKITNLTKVWTAVQWLLNSALFANPIGLVVLAVIGLIAIIVLVATKTKFFQIVWKAVWTFVKDQAQHVADWFTGKILPSFRSAFNALGTIVDWFKRVWNAAWGGVKDFVNGVWTFIRDKVFNPLKKFITETIPNAFSSGVTAIGKFWKGLEALARKPIEFVVDIINRGIIDTFNKVSGFFHGPTFDHVSISPGDGLGQRAPRGAGDGPGTGDGPGLIGLLSGPAKWVSDRVGLGGLASKFGNSPFVKILTGMGGALKDSLIGQVKNMIGEMFASSGGGGSVGAGGLRSGIAGVLANLRNVFRIVPLISGFRRNARTLTGNPSYHASGRAVDIPPVRAWALYLRAVFGSKLRELITPWNELNILNGRPHRYTGAVWNQHNFPGGNAHIHAAMDSGGWLQPGLNIVPNGTGRPERVTSPGSEDAMLARLDRLIAAVERVAPGVGAAINGVGAGLLQSARAR